MTPGNLSTRERELLRLLSEGGDQSLAAISQALEVSVVTVRSDLNRLAERGYIVRTRGGALPAFHPKILARQKSSPRAKSVIAQAAAELIEDGDQIMISAGTTSTLIAKHLLGKRDVHVVTNSTLLIPYARVNPSLRVTIVGGEFLPSGEAIVGPLALEALERFHVKTAFIGVDGFSLETGLTADSVEVAEIVKAMSAQADQSIVVADSAKHGRAGFAYIAPLTDMDRLITDGGLEKGVVATLEGSGLSVVLT